MGDRLVYRDKPQDFEALARACPSLAPHLVSRGRGKPRSIDFSREESVEALTECILWQDFGVRWQRPPKSLIPPVPNRFTYILWIKDLLATSLGPGRGNAGEEVRGVDIGTGGTLIYALLGAAAFGWSFLATENCHYSLRWAERNLRSNPSLVGLVRIRDTSPSAPASAGGAGGEDPGIHLGLVLPEGDGDGEDGHRIEVALSFQGKGEEAEAEAGATMMETDEAEAEAEAEGGAMAAASAESKCLVGVLDPSVAYDFCMCNPPFFDTEEARPLHKPGHGGLANELRCPGGELAFVGRIVADSLALRTQVRWYTTMVGRKKTLKTLLAALRAKPEVRGIRTTTFVCGRTTRWGLAWTFHADQRRPGGGGAAGAGGEGGTKRKSTNTPAGAEAGGSGGSGEGIASRLLALLEGEGGKHSKNKKKKKQGNQKLARSRAFMVRSAVAPLKQALADAMEGKLMWDSQTPADASHGFGVQQRNSPGNPFESLWTFSVPDELSSRADGSGSGSGGGNFGTKHLKSSPGSVPPSSAGGGGGRIAGFAGSSVRFKTTLFQYSKDLVSVQCALGDGEASLFQALLACVEKAVSEGAR